jgi:hypothetical protein
LRLPKCLLLCFGRHIEPQLNGSSEKTIRMWQQGSQGCFQSCLSPVLLWGAEPVRLGLAHCFPVTFHNRSKEFCHWTFHSQPSMPSIRLTRAGAPWVSRSFASIPAKTKATAKRCTSTLAAKGDNKWETTKIREGHAYNSSPICGDDEHSPLQLFL